MIIYHNPDEWESVVEHKTCAYHQAHPGVNFAGCTCWSSYMMRRKALTPKETP